MFELVYHRGWPLLYLYLPYIFFIAYIDILTFQYHRYIKISNYGAVSNKFTFYVKVNIFKYFQNAFFLIFQLFKTFFNFWSASRKSFTDSKETYINNCGHGLMKMRLFY